MFFASLICGLLGARLSNWSQTGMHFNAVAAAIAAATIELLRVTRALKRTKALA